MAAIYKRELKSFFNSFVGWLYAAVMTAVMGIYFFLCNMLIGYPTISYVLQSVVFIIVFTIPILTMRSLSEERKYKTDQLILTSPVSVGKIVLGKYLALMTVFVRPLIIIGFTPLILMFVGEFQTGLSYTSLLGFFLYGCLGLAIGLFISSLTESVVIAAVLTLVVMFAGYIMSGLCSIISTAGTTAFADYAAKVLNCFDMVGKFDSLSSGYFEVDAIVYYVSFTLFILFCTVQSIQKRRYAFAGKGIKIGAYSIFNILVAAALTILVNVGLNYVPKQYISYDVTVNKLFTLTDDTVQLISNLSQDVTIYVLVDEESKDGDVDRTLQQLKGYNDHIQVEYVSPVANPMFYYKYTEVQPAANSLIIVGENASTVVDYNDMYLYQMDYYTYSNELVGYDGEGQIVSALARVASTDVPKFYMILGHDEWAFDETFLNALYKENVTYDTLNLYAVDAFPEDAQGIILNAPYNDYSNDDKEKVISYLEQGGNAFIIIPQAQVYMEMENFEQIVGYYGVSIVDGLIVENDRGLYYQSPYDLFPNIEYNDITGQIYDGTVFAPISRGLAYDGDSEDVIYRPLLTTSDESFSKTNVFNLEDYRKTDADIDGPFVIAMEVEKPAANERITKAVIVSTEKMFTSEADNVVPGYNTKLFGNIVANLADHDISMAIPVKYYEIGNFAFSARTVFLSGFFIFLMTIFYLLAGLVIWISRRHK